MGDRVSITFVKDEERSITLFSHWGGLNFVNIAKRYVKKLKAERTGSFQPLDRFEPNTVMVDFIRYITKGVRRVTSDLYLGKDPEDGDNLDNGNFDINLGNEGIEIIDGEIE